MNVGSILNGDSPQDASANTSRVSDVDRDDMESRGLRSSLPELHHRQLINNLLNDAPQNGARAVVARHDSNELQVENAGDLSVPSAPEDDDDDVDADAASIDRELAEASLKESQEKAAKTADLGTKTLANSADSDARNAKNGLTKREFRPETWPLRFPPW
ncbi:hypothetical protein HF325_002970 [Metschnikowia pulcherrima]|uniref:Uncharacterized protein n=1 Tax=Metschnikowia pulcherrima TaxID=27326 RepID=A0A8H7GRY2_9ASCO|nr:hypothetical protein HF325_002970 [Metschnikowia pulcherrima]